MTTIMTRRN